MPRNKLNQIQEEMLTNLSGLFFISGFSALIYQICWQRLLFTGFGVDLISITVIVSVFMTGLGTGAFFGGRIADKFSKKTILIFCSFEFSIGAFGLISGKLIIQLQNLLLHANILQITFFNFLLLVVPTFLMGATLPILTSFFNRFIENIGESIGRLYFYNTIGAAFGALATGFILFNYIGLFEVVYVAAILNIIIAVVVFLKYGRKYEK